MDALCYVTSLVDGDNETLSQDVVYALAHATGKTGRFTLIERWRNNERLLAPQEHPLKVNCLIDLDVATGIP
jgi:Ras association domain-containing protein 7/8